MNKADYILRFLSKTRKEGECWIWTGAQGSAGYGQAQFASIRTGAHRVAWMLFRDEPLPRELDHLCNNRLCVNPAHLEAVTHAQNMKRSMDRRGYCKHGHEYTEQTTYWYRGGRRCRVCLASRQREFKARRCQDRCQR